MSQNETLKNEFSQTLWKGTFGSTFFALGFISGLY